ADHTATMRALSSVVRGDRGPLLDQLRDRAALDAWLDRYAARLASEDRPADEIARAMDGVNPCYIPRNHLVEEALTAATAGDLDPVERLVAVLRDPFTERPGFDRYALPAPTEFGEGYQTFCGT
ncbi:MAG: hypothetical protein ACTHN0_00835, partial [Aquihabitans sp.]